MNKNDFAIFPPRGWNSFDYYDTTVKEQEVRENAEYLAANLKEYGWEFVVVDIQWYAYDTGSRREEYEYIPFGRVEMDEFGRLLPCPEKFPSAGGGKGFGPLAAYIHSLGLKFGIHMMRGIPRTAAERRLPVYGTDTTADRVADPYSVCGWNPDMYGLRSSPEGQQYYNSVMELYADWGVDYIKCDDICNTLAYPDRPDAGIPEIVMLHEAIQRCGRPIVLSLSPGPAILEQAHVYLKYANAWRLSGDFWDEWVQLREMFDYCEKWQFYVRPGCYPDCDMLPVGRIGKGFGKERQTRFTWEEQKTMVTLWCMVHSPLMIGAELTQLDEATLSLLNNRQVLELQDSEQEAAQIRKNGQEAIWISRNGKEDRVYLAFFWFQETEGQISVSEEELIPYLRKMLSEYKDATEVWTGRVRRPENGSFMDTVQGHGTSLWRLNG